jgi:hypothetical protein
MRFWGKGGRREEIGKQKASWYLKPIPTTSNPIAQARNIGGIFHFLRLFEVFPTV